MLDINYYENMLFNYNFVGGADKQTVPDVSISRVDGPNSAYVIKYRFFRNSDSLDDTYYHNNGTEVQNLIEGQYYNYVVENKFESALSSSSNTSDHYSLFSDVANLILVGANDDDFHIAIGQVGPDYLYTQSSNPLVTVPAITWKYENDLPIRLGLNDIHGDIFVNHTSSLWSEPITLGSQAFKVILEETLHSLGVDARAEDSVGTLINNQKYSVTAYSSDHAPGMYGYGTVAPHALQIMDIAALQAIYGANFAKRAGDTTYNLSAMNPNFASNPDKAFLFTIWDGGGTDTLDASTSQVSAELDLRQGRFSSIGNTATGLFEIAKDSDASATDPDPGNVAIAFNAIIENAKGTDEDDTLIGNAWNNRLWGGSGNDIIYGDGIIYDNNVGYGAIASEHHSGNKGVRAAADGSGRDILDGGEGNDALYGGAGYDTLIGGTGNDAIVFGEDGGIGRGGAGDDDYYIQLNGSDVTILDAQGDNFIYMNGATINDFKFVSSDRNYTTIEIAGTKVKISNVPQDTSGGIGSGIGSDVPEPPKPGISKIFLAPGGETYYVYVVPTESTAAPEGTPEFSFVNAISSLMDSFRDFMDDVIAFEGSPLVLDLDGDGVEVSAFGQSGQVYWDIDQDGFGEASSWVMPDDGLLAFDRNGNGYIDDNNELFGTLTTDGFSVLSAMDNNNDSQITSSDANFSRLRVWQDINSDGFSQTNELRSLTQVGITAIDLNASLSNGNINGNQVSHVSTFTMNGGTHEIADVWFNFDQMNSVYQGSQNLTDEVAVLPELRGYGNMMNLRVAMSKDGTLQTMVQSLANMSVDEVFDPANSVIGLVNDIMFRWAGVDGMDPNGRGDAIGDARVLEFLEELTGKDFYQRGYEDPMEIGSQMLRATYGGVQGAIFTHLLTQVAGAQIFEQSGNYNAETDSLEGTFVLDFDALESVFDYAGATGEALSAQWINVLTVIKFTIGFENLSSTDTAALEALVDTTTGGTYTLEELIGVRDAYFGVNTLVTLVDGNNDNLIYGMLANEFITGSANADEIHGNGGNDEIYGSGGNDDLFGESGVDTIYGEDGADILTGGEGNDYLVGGAGNDTYVYTSGVDVIQEAQGNDEIVLPIGYELADMRLEYSDEAQTGLDIYFNDVLSIRLQNWYDPNGKVERITFADNSVFNLVEAFTDTTDGTPEDDILTGHDHAYQPNDEIWGQDGNDIITGGLGDDLLYGNTGNDTYFVGSGVDTIYEEGSETSDTIRFGAGVGAGDLRFETDADGLDLFIYFSDVLKARVVGQFSGAGSVEYISLNGVSTINLMTTVTTQVGSATEDYITGIAQGGPTSNIIKAKAGNDIVMAGDGDDVINGGTGDDTLNGGEGNDSYVYDLSYNAGFDTVIDLGGTADVISVNTSLASANLSFSRNETNNLIVNLGGQQAMLLAGFFQTQGRIESIAFTDQTLSLNSIVNILGTSANETLNGDASTLFGDDLIFGYGGNDTLNGLTGGDVLYGGDGTDTINGGDGNDTLFGEAGADTMNGGAGDDVMEGGAAADTYLYSAGSDTIREITNGNGVNDILKFGSGITLSNLTFVRDLALDYTGNNLWVNQGSNSTLIEGQFVGTGIETLLFADNSTTSMTGVYVQTLGSEYSETIFGLTGYSETINGRDGADDIYGNDGNDILIGGEGVDALYGGTENDILNGESGEDFLDGQQGHDIYYVGAGDIAYESGGNTNDLYLISAAATGSYTLSDNGGSNDAVYITLLAGQSYTFTSDGSSLCINLTSGSDTASITITSQYGALPESIVERIIFGSYAGNVNAYDGTNTHTGGFVMTENGLSQTVTYTAAAETINGSTSTLVSDNINAAGGNDIVYGFAGADYVYAGDGNDYVYGGDDNDTLYGEAGDDVVSGEAGDDTLWGGAGVDYLWGNTGNDTLYGEAGADALRGLEGDDIIWGGDDNDNIRGDDVDSASNFIGAGYDELHGGNGNDHMAGGAGDDILYGDAGQDTLWGNDGADTFVIEANSNAMDYVMDFDWQNSLDRLDIAGVFNESYDVVGSLSSFVQLQALSAHTRVQVDRDGSGSAFGWENVAQLQGKTGLDLGTLVSSGALIVD